jgi:hypothetical protein
MATYIRPKDTRRDPAQNENFTAYFPFCDGVSRRGGPDGEDPIIDKEHDHGY